MYIGNSMRKYGIVIWLSKIWKIRIRNSVRIFWQLLMHWEGYVIIIFYDGFVNLMIKQWQRPSWVFLWSVILTWKHWRTVPLWKRRWNLSGMTWRGPLVSIWKRISTGLRQKWLKPIWQNYISGHRIGKMWFLWLKSY